MRRRDAEDYEGEEEEQVDPRDLARFDGEEVECPNCGRMMYADAEQCPHCRMFRSDEEEAAEAGLRKRPLWFTVTAWICVIGLTWWLAAVVIAWTVDWWRR